MRRGAGWAGRGAGLQGGAGLKTPKRGAGSNPRRRPVDRNGAQAQAHTQTHSRRPVKSNRKIKFRGAKFSSKDADNHFFNGEGVRTNGTFNGGHTTTTYARDVAASGARPLGSTPHPRVWTCHGLVPPQVVV